MYFHLLVKGSLGDNCLQINTATNVSKKLRGAAIHKIFSGRTSRFQITIHIKKNAVNQAKKVVCHRVNLLERINNAIANEKPQMTHPIPFMGSDGKMRFNPW